AAMEQKMGDLNSYISIFKYPQNFAIVGRSRRHPDSKRPFNGMSVLLPQPNLQKKPARLSF
ncbi:MAG: hypothetical protein WAO55_06790, partial [Candidatus Manganitrophaceae bacterium]